jgi:hypothetical protein
MRALPFVVATLLACAASPAFAQPPPGQGAAVPPPILAQPAPPPPEPAAPPAASPPKTESVVPKSSLADSNAPARGSRFSFNRVDDGFLRLDNQTGQVAYCSARAIGWSCEMVPEERTALEKEIARLKDEVASLKVEVEALREPPRPPADLTPAPPAPPPAAADKDRDTTKLREDLERARLAFENAWRRLVDMIINLQKDLARRG